MELKITKYLDFEEFFIDKYLIVVTFSVGPSVPRYLENELTDFDRPRFWEGIAIETELMILVKLEKMGGAMRKKVLNLWYFHHHHHRCPTLRALELHAVLCKCLDNSRVYFNVSGNVIARMMIFGM